MSVPAAPTVLPSQTVCVHFGYWMDRVSAGEHVIVTRRGKPRMRLIPAT